MSIDENTNSTETSEHKQSEQNQKSEALNNSVESAKNAAGNFLSTFLALKDSNPKVFFGAIGAAVVLLLVLLMSGGGSQHKLPVHQAKAIVAGQTYVLKSANAYDPRATIRLVAVPGVMEAYDDTEEADREGGCKHINEGTQVKAVQLQDAFGKKDAYAEVEMLNGECQGKKGWALAINLQ